MLHSPRLKKERGIIKKVFSSPSFYLGNNYLFFFSRGRSWRPSSVFPQQDHQENPELPKQKRILPSPFA